MQRRTLAAVVTAGYDLSKRSGVRSGVLYPIISSLHTAINLFGRRPVLKCDGGTRSLRRIVAVLLAALLCLAVFPPNARAAAGNKVLIYQDQQVDISYRYVNAAAGRYHVEITVDNRSTSAISDWSLMFELADVLNDLELATLRSQTEGQVLIGSAQPTRVIKPGGTVIFWYWAALGAGGPHIPQWVRFLPNGLLPTTDADKDRLPDYIEARWGTSTSKADTDGDGLSDFVEWVIGTDPLKADTDGNAVPDGREDLDSDSVVNIDEVAARTSPTEADSDGDGLSDGQERVHRTDPLRPDTDGDKVTDGDEVAIGSDPLVAEPSFDVTRTGIGALTTPSVTIKGLRPEQVRTFSVNRLPAEQTEFPPETPGYIDRGYEFTVAGSFGQAEVSFRFDPSLRRPGFEPAIYTYDEASQRLVELPDQQVNGNAVTARTTHFSKYILLNRLEFTKAFTFTFLEVPDSGSVFDRVDVAFAIDSSGSMSSNDPNNERIQVAKNFVQRLGPDDRAAVVDFDTGATVRAPLTNDRGTLNSALDAIDSSGGTSISAGVATALGLFTDPAASQGPKTLRTVILLTDGFGDYDPALTAAAKTRGIVINTVGLGAGVDASLLTAIATQTGGRYYAAADAEQLATIFQSIADASDLLRDSDKDGVNDYYEKEMRAGHLLLGNGVPVGLMDPLNPDSDGDGVKDGDEISIRTVQLSSTAKLVYVVLRSHPLRPDTDGDGLRDNVDPRPLIFGQREMLIHQSADREGHRKEPNIESFQVPPSAKVADDLTFNDYSFSELRKLGTIFNVAPITPEFMMWGEFNDIMKFGQAGADADHRAAVNQLRDEFRYGHGGMTAGTVSVADDYDPSRFHTVATTELRNAVSGSQQMQSYIRDAKALIVQSIIANSGGTAQLQVQDDLNQNLLYQLFTTKSMRYPIYDFSLGDANERALSIAIHQFHGHQIRLKDYAVSGNSFSGTLVFRSYDHFGLDPDDEITGYGFVDWFTLQHYDRFNGRYVPPLAAVNIEIPISGSF